MRLSIEFSLAAIMALILYFVANKSSPILTALLLAALFGFCLHPALSLPWITLASPVVIKAWRIFVVVALLLIVVVRFGIWVWPPPTAAAAQLKVEPEVKIAEQKEASPAKHSPEAQPVKPQLKHYSRVEANPLTIPKTGAQQSNSGGINVQQVAGGSITGSPITVTDPALLGAKYSLSPEEARDLKKALIDTPTLTRFSFYGDDKDSRELHKQLSDICGLAKWSIAMGSAIIGPEHRPGIVIRVMDKNNPAAVLLQKKLGQYGIHAPIEASKLGSTHGLTEEQMQSLVDIDIGSRPPNL